MNDSRPEVSRVTRIPLVKPYITQEVKDRVSEVLDSGDLTEGQVTKAFEESMRPLKNPAKIAVWWMLRKW
ncbi:MAG: hypothetical protein JRJ03_15765 [Deltaproteobacteria bacterium]|nr:hypothetical protein [Deltaproteobacteria bacterium]MBW2066367.1 hypothetical protein [Deltaproteobacteria bacterium]